MRLYILISFFWFSISLSLLSWDRKVVLKRDEYKCKCICLIKVTQDPKYIPFIYLVSEAPSNNIRNLLVFKGLTYNTKSTRSLLPRVFLKLNHGYHVLCYLLYQTLLDFPYKFEWGL